MHITRRGFLAMTTTTAAAFGLASCTPNGSSARSSSLRLGIDRTTYGFIGSPLDGLNLQYFGGKATYESLLTIDPLTSALKPLLASRYELSGDQKSMTVDLHTNVDFVDGTHLNAQALADYCDLLFASDGYFYKASLTDFYGLKVVPTGEYSLKLTTKVGMDETFFNEFMLWTGIASPKAAQNREQLKKATAGTGPYIIKEAVPDVSISYARNPHYWDPKALDFDSLTYQVFDDDVAATNALRSGQIDATPLSTASLAPSLVKDGFDIHRAGGSFRLLLINDFTGKIVPALGDVRVRRAIAMAFDQRAMLKSLENGYGTVSDEVFRPGQPEYVKGADDRYPFDVQGAKSLMAQAGYANGFDVVIPSASVGYYPSSYEPVVRQSLADIGIRVKFDRQADGAALVKAWTSNKYPIHFHNLGYDQPISQYRGPHPTLGAHFSDDQIFKKLVATIENGSADASTQAATKLGEYMLEQACFIPLIHFGQNWASAHTVRMTLGRFTFWQDLRSMKAAA